jgi:predicted MFS family arabinose efflux permease
MNATIRSINRAKIVIGAPLGGVTGDAYGYRTTLWIAAGAFLVIAVALACTRFRSARIGDVYSNPA